mgnify:CR=1 FL=1
MVHTYGTNMQQSVWQLFSLFFKPNFHGKKFCGISVYTIKTNLRSCTLNKVFFSPRCTQTLKPMKL